MRLGTLVRRGPIMLRAALRDLRYGGRPLGGTVRTRYSHLGAFHSTNTPYEDMARLFDEVTVEPDATIVDVGCGKGRSLNWLIGRFPGNAIVGIELDPDVCAATARRLRRRANVTIVCGDATTLLPPDATVFYLFNPFDATVMGRFAAALLERPAATVVYYNAKHLEPFRAEPRFAIRELDDPRLGHRSAIVTLRTAAEPRSPSGAA
ncbi:MAG TPA: methyltransferase domain-containing protein [Gaiellaceae bacterium]|jgi:SAM-dependent methyltransferase